MDASSTFQDSLPLSSDAMLSQLDAWDLQYKLHSHVPLRTVEDAKQVEADLGVPGEKAFRIKNFYLRDRKKRNYLVTLEQDRIIDLKSLAKDLGVGNMSFGSADRLIEHLGIRPGAVSPLAMITGVEKGVTFYLDAEAQNADVIYMHPLVNDRTIAMNMSDLIVFMERVGSPVHWLS
ncbi:MAG: prolyl-tRNA synthetase associated domain-containing protein [Pseudoruegeria sp.]